MPLVISQHCPCLLLYCLLLYLPRAIFAYCYICLLIPEPSDLDTNYKAGKVVSLLHTIGNRQYLNMWIVGSSWPKKYTEYFSDATNIWLFEYSPIIGGIRCLYYSIRFGNLLFRTYSIFNLIFTNYSRILRTTLPYCLKESKSYFLAFFNHCGQLR